MALILSPYLTASYDQIGLLKPEAVSTTGYRLYSNQDLEKLQQILFFKELSFSLQEIKEILDNPQFDRKQALKAQKELLIKKKERLEAIISAVEKTLASMEGGARLTEKEMFAAFDMSEIEKHQRKYAEEVRQKYGHTDAYKQSRERTAGYTQNHWAEIMAQSNTIYKKIAALMEKGPADPEVQEAVDEWRQLITNNFYDCTLEIFRGLGDLYVNDERFTANIEKYRPGLAGFMRDAMHVYCDNREK